MSRHHFDDSGGIRHVGLCAPGRCDPGKLRPVANNSRSPRRPHHRAGTGCVGQFVKTRRNSPRSAEPLMGGRADSLSVVLWHVSRHSAFDGFLTQMRFLTESGARADAPTTSNTPAVCPCLLPSPPPPPPPQHSQSRQTQHQRTRLRDGGKTCDAKTLVGALVRHVVGEPARRPQAVEIPGPAAGAGTAIRRTIIID